MATQEQAVRTNNTKGKIDKTQENSLCRICGKAEESVSHLLSECSKLKKTTGLVWNENPLGNM